MAVLTVTKKNFNSDVKPSEKKVLLDFYADWCMPCRMLAPIVEEISKERTDILVGRVNVDEEPELARAFGVSSIPMLALMKDGVLLNAAVGAMPKDAVLRFVDESV